MLIRLWIIFHVFFIFLPVLVSPWEVKTLYGKLTSLIDLETIMNEVEEFKTFGPWGYLFSKLGDAAISVIATVTEAKFRVSQARYFLGDTFADRFDSYLKQSQAHENIIGISVNTIVDYNDTIRMVTQKGSDLVIGNGLLQAQAWILTKLPAPFNNIGHLMTNKSLLYFTRNYLGGLIAMVLFPQGVFSAYVIASLPMLIRNPWVFRTAYLEVNQALRLIRTGGAVASAAVELINPNIPIFIFDDFVQRNRAALKASKFSATALAYLRNVPMPRYSEYFAVLIRHFPKQMVDFTSGKQAISSGYNFLTSKDSDALLQLADIVGVFKFPKEQAVESFLRFVKGIETYFKRHKEEESHEMVLLYLDYFLDNLNIHEQLLTEEADEPEFVNKCHSILGLLLPTNDVIEYALRSGLTAWSALAARYLPVIKGDKKILQGERLIKLSIERATPLAMLSVLRNIPTKVMQKLSLHKYRPPDALYVNSSRSRQLVFDAFSNLNNYPYRPAFICRTPLYPHGSDVPYTQDIPINLSFLPQNTKRPLSAEEIRTVAVAVAYLVFNIPLQVGLEQKKVGVTVIETINLILDYRCGYFRDRVVTAQATHRIKKLPKIKLRSPPHLQMTKSKPSVLPYQLGSQ